MDERPRLTDLVPRRLSVFALLLSAALAVVAGLEVLYFWMSELTPTTTDGCVAAFDLDGEGSLANWFSSVILILAGLLAVLVYTIRRHKTDDYRGYYRIWLWAAMCWFLMGIDEASSLHEGFKEMMIYLTGTPVYGDGSLWWVVPYFFLLGAVGSRLLLDMLACRLSSAALVACAGCYVLAVVAHFGWILPQNGAKGVMLEEGAEMIGNLMLLLAMGLHARHVILDAEGLLPRREPQPQQDWEEEEQQADEWIKVDSAHGTPQPLLKRTKRLSGSQDEESPVRRKLTKAEKKALRKRLVRKRLERERQQHGNW